MTEDNSFAQEGVDLGGADTVVFRQSLDAMCTEAHVTAVVTHLDVRVMILAMGDPGERVHERHGLVVILELERAGYFGGGVIQ